MSKSKRLHVHMCPSCGNQLGCSIVHDLNVQSDTISELRGLVAEMLALNPFVSGDMEKVRVWADVLKRLKVFCKEESDE